MTCVVVITLVTLPQMASAFNLVGVTVVRFLALKRPLTFRHDMTKRKTGIAVGVVWVVAAVISVGVYFRITAPGRGSISICKVFSIKSCL